MNAQVVIAVSSLVVGMFCVIFFYLAGQEGFDENSVFWGTLSVDGDDLSIKFAQNGGKSMLTTFGDGTSEFLTEIDGELVHFDYDASGALTNCESNSNVDFDQMGNFFVDVVDGVVVVGDDAAAEGEDLTVTYSFTEGEASADFLPTTPSYEDCQAIAGRRRLDEAAELVEPVDRRLSAQSQQSKDSYNSCTYEVAGWGVGGTACVLVSGCRFAFRGSDDASDWVSNGFGVFSSSRRGPRNLKLHGGFLKEFDRLQPHIESKARSCGNSAEWIGHSLGGAISSVARQHYNFGTTYTWGQPKVYDDNVGCVEGNGGIRMYNENDPVPGNLFGFMYTYNHGKTGTELYRDSYCTKKFWGICYRWGKSGYKKRNKGCNDHSGTWDTDIGAHSMDTYHANT